MLGGRTASFKVTPSNPRGAESGLVGSEATTMGALESKIVTCARPSLTFPTTLSLTFSLGGSTCRLRSRIIDEKGAGILWYGDGQVGCNYKGKRDDALAIVAALSLHYRCNRSFPILLP